jgi:hypothetical protein
MSRAHGICNTQYEKNRLTVSHCDGSWYVSQTTYHTTPKAPLPMTLTKLYLHSTTNLDPPARYALYMAYVEITAVGKDCEWSSKKLLVTMAVI